MSTFIDFFITMWDGLVSLLNNYNFDFFGQEMSLFGILFGFLLLSIIISVFWKGARG